MTPSISIRTCHHSLKKISDAELIQNGRQLKQKRPKGVIKVVSSLDLGDSGSLPKPTFAVKFCDDLALA